MENDSEKHGTFYSDSDSLVTASEASVGVLLFDKGWSSSYDNSSESTNRSYEKRTQGVFSEGVDILNLRQE